MQVFFSRPCLGTRYAATLYLELLVLLLATDYKNSTAILEGLQ